MTKNRIRVMVFALIIMAVLALATAACAEITWEFNASDGTLTISGTGAMPSYWSLNTSAGDRNGSSAPWQTSFRTSIKKVVVESGVTNIGARAFMDCINLTSISLPETVKTIDDAAFYGCDSLYTVNFPSSLERIEYCGFYSCLKLQYVTLNQGLSYIGRSAFASCSRLSSVTIPNTVTKIDKTAFNACTSLKQLAIPSSVTNLGQAVVANCTHLEVLTIPMTSYLGYYFSGTTSSSSYSYNSAVPSTLKTVIVNQQSSTLPDYAFYNCRYVENIVLPKSVTSLGTCALAGCTSLKMLLYSSPISGIESAGLSDSVKRCFADVDCGITGYYSTYLWGLQSDGTLTLYSMKSGYTLSYGSEAVRPWQSYISQIRHLRFEGPIREIGQCVFQNCTNLEDVVLPDGLQTIDSWAFSNCTRLTEMVFPASLHGLGSRAFENCTALKSITYLGTGFESYSYRDNGDTYDCNLYIYDNSYSGCTRLTDLYFGGSQIALEAILDSYNSSAMRQLQRHCAANSLSAMYLNSGETDYNPENYWVLTDDGTLTVHGTGVLARNYGAPRWYYLDYYIKNVVICEGITGIQNMGFMGYYKGDKSITVPASVTSVDELSTSFETITFLGDAPTITQYTFKYGTPTVYYPCNNTTWENAYNKAYVANVTWAVNHGELVHMPQTSATCALDGNNEYWYCEMCDGHLNEDGVAMTEEEWLLPALNHPSMNHHEAVAATCLTDGNDEYYSCDDCGLFFMLDGEEYVQIDADSWVISASGHTEVVDEARDATCSETGLTEGSHCSVCGEVLAAQEILPMLEHTVVVDEARNATCSETGLTEGSHCSTCGEVLAAQEILPMLGHTVVTVPGKAATCLEEGLTDSSYCSVCNQELQAQEIIPAGGHTEVVIPGMPATCTEDGLTDDIYCSVCYTVLQSAQIIPAKGHAVITMAGKEPTCAATGMTERQYCSVCNTVLAERKILPKSNIHHLDGGACSVCHATFDTTGMNVMTLPAELTEIEAEAFTGISAQAVVVPDNCGKIGAKAFADCTGLKYIFLPEGITVDNTAFSGCTVLQIIYR